MKLSSAEALGCCFVIKLDSFLQVFLYSKTPFIEKSQVVLSTGVSLLGTKLVIMDRHLQILFDSYTILIKKPNIGLGYRNPLPCRQQVIVNALFDVFSYSFASLETESNRALRCRK